MAFDVMVDCSKDRARWALMQFALRRGMRIVEPWYLDGVRIEGPPAPPRGGWESHRPGWGDRINTLLLNWPSDRPAVDIEFSRKKGRTVVSLSPGSREDCLMLAHRIEAFLRDAAAQAVQSPAVCPTCQAPVEVVTASYCARCGKRLSMSAADYPPKRRKQAAAASSLAEEQLAAPAQSSVDERNVEAAASAPASGSPVASRPIPVEAVKESESQAERGVTIERDEAVESEVAVEAPTENAESNGAAGEAEPVRQRRRARDAEAEAVVED
jgi:hypothetical protein